MKETGNSQAFPLCRMLWPALKLGVLVANETLGWLCSGQLALTQASMKHMNKIGKDNCMVMDRKPATTHQLDLTVVSLRLVYLAHTCSY